jgi:hypothetical protein
VQGYEWLYSSCGRDPFRAEDHLIAFPNFDSDSDFMLRQQRKSRALNVLHAFTCGDLCRGDMVVAIH